jgi:hypothetical protein
MQGVVMRLLAEIVATAILTLLCGGLLAGLILEVIPGPQPCPVVSQ